MAPAEESVNARAASGRAMGCHSGMPAPALSSHRAEPYRGARRCWPCCPLLELQRLPDRKGRLGEARGHGSLRPAAHQRHYARFDLWPYCHRLHDGFRNHRHGELRPWRCVHGLRLHSAHYSLASHDLARHRLVRDRAVHRSRRRDVLHLAPQLGDRAGRLSAAARLLPARAADLGDRDVDLSVELRPGGAGSARQIHSSVLQ